MRNVMIITALVSLLFSIGCSDPSSPAVREPSLTGTEASLLSLGIDTTVIETGVLGTDVEEGLKWMREEEKLARDVYTALAARWGSRPFGNIAASEERHTEIVRALLKHYGVDDPAASTPAGTFVNTELQRLYDQLMEQGLQSSTDAYRVGVLIEETDIADLDRHLDALTTESVIRRAYEHLRAASVRHLRAFSRRL